MPSVPIKYLWDIGCLTLGYTEGVFIIVFSTLIHSFFRFSLYS